MRIFAKATIIQPLLYSLSPISGYYIWNINL